jgi:hypothetical protein
MLQIIYASGAVKPYARNELVELLRVARQRNAAADISGMLLYHDGAFLQVLEGPDYDVDAIYAKIQKDPRHTNFLLLRRETILKKEFENWSMGFVDSTKVAEQFEGFVDYVRHLKDMTIETEGARKILKKFQEGLWHQSADR